MPRKATPRAESSPRGRIPLLWLWGALSLALFGTGSGLFVWRAGLLDRFTPPAGAVVELENELADATSPYLRSAASQPVHWQQWGERAFTLARELNRPIWLDIGAVWCHWCHVMDRESYENAEIAELINRYFIPVKVDRDERPDIDQRYQKSHQLLTGRGGGWPLTMFLMPDGVPFAGGTYFPPESRGGMPGIAEMAPRIAAAFYRQPDQVASVAAQVRDTFARLEQEHSQADPLTAAVVADIAAAVGARFDPTFGGFGTAPGPKFPGAEGVRLALAQGYLNDDRQLIDRALDTLDAYAESGIRDYVLGGFFRYSVNRELTVPHFEKMDYVQAALLRAYLEAYRLTAEARYRDAAEDILRYVDSTLSDLENGGFYPHQDADLDLDDDGSYYTFSVAELEQAVRDDAIAKALGLHFGVDLQGEMETDRSQNVLRVVKTAAEVAAAMDITEEEASARIAAGLARLAAEMQQRPAPFVEKTVYTDRSAQMIAAYLDAWATLGDEQARDFALTSLDTILEHAVDSDGSVRHATAGGESYVTGMMSDYARLVDALLDAYQVAGSRRYLDLAARIMERAVALFWDEENGGFFDRVADDEGHALLATRSKEFTDSPQPGDNAVAARALEKLYLITLEERWHELAERTLAVFASRARTSGTFAGTYALALQAVLNKPAQTVVIGPDDDARTHELGTAAWRTYRPGRLVLQYDPETVDLATLPETVAAAAEVFLDDATPRAYVCVGTTCAPPTTEPAQVAKLVAEYRLPARDAQAASQPVITN